MLRDEDFANVLSPLGHNRRSILLEDFAAVQVTAQIE